MPSFHEACTSFSYEKTEKCWRTRCFDASIRPSFCSPKKAMHRQSRIWAEPTQQTFAINPRQLSAVVSYSHHESSLWPLPCPKFSAGAFVQAAATERLHSWGSTRRGRHKVPCEIQGFEAQSERLGISERPPSISRVQGSNRLTRRP